MFEFRSKIIIIFRSLIGRSGAAVLALQGAKCLIHVEEKGAGMARATVMVPGATEETTLPRGTRPKRGKAPTKLERLETLRERILPLVRDLMTEGFSAPVPLRTATFASGITAPARKSRISRR